MLDLHCIFFDFYDGIGSAGPRRHGWMNSSDIGHELS
jgi:hypothetical protein